MRINDTIGYYKILIKQKDDFDLTNPAFTIVQNVIDKIEFEFEGYRYLTRFNSRQRITIFILHK